jgi:hypothetical protein
MSWPAGRLPPGIPESRDWSTSDSDPDSQSPVHPSPHSFLTHSPSQNFNVQPFTPGTNLRVFESLRNITACGVTLFARFIHTPKHSDSSQSHWDRFLTYPLQVRNDSPILAQSYSLPPMSSSPKQQTTRISSRLLPQMAQKWRQWRQRGSRSRWKH